MSQLATYGSGSGHREYTLRGILLLAGISRLTHIIEPRISIACFNGNLGPCPLPSENGVITLWAGFPLLSYFSDFDFMQVRKAVITAAGPQQHRLPLQQLVCRQGEDKTALQLIVDETIAAGIEEICVVIMPGDQAAYEQAAGSQLGSIQFVEQPQPLGYADAIHRAKDFVAGEPFLHLVGDHLYLSKTDAVCAKQLIDVAREFECSVSAVQATRENKLPYFGIVSGTRVPRYDRVYEVVRVVEKPTPTFAEQELVTPGLRAGHYLGFFGMHVLTGEIMTTIEQLLSSSPDAAPTLSDAVEILRTRQKYLAHEVQGTRYNLGIQYGLLIAQLAIGLSGRHRELILSEMVELLAGRMEAGVDQ